MSIGSYEVCYLLKAPATPSSSPPQSPIFLRFAISSNNPIYGRTAGSSFFLAFEVFFVALRVSWLNRFVVEGSNLIRVKGTSLSNLSPSCAYLQAPLKQLPASKCLHIARLHGLVVDAHCLQVLKLSHCKPWAKHLVQDTTMFLFLSSVLHFNQWSSETFG